MTMLELLEESPIIAAVKSWEGLEKSLKSECKVVFVLFGTICDIDQIVARIKDAGKVAIVHVDMIQGLSTKRVAVDFIAHNTRADGIISTKNTLVEHAKEMGLYAIQRTFVVDSIALDTLKKQIEMFRPDAVEIMPGVMPSRAASPPGTSSTISRSGEASPAMAPGMAVSSRGRALAWTCRTSPRASMKIISSGISVLRIQNATRCGCS